MNRPLIQTIRSFTGRTMAKRSVTLAQPLQINMDKKRRMRVLRVTLWTKPTWSSLAVALIRITRFTITCQGSKSKVTTLRQTCSTHRPTHNYNKKDHGEWIKHLNTRWIKETHLAVASGPTSRTPNWTEISLLQLKLIRDSQKPVQWLMLFMKHNQQKTCKQLWVSKIQPNTSKLLMQRG
jgi:hypothetical protein